MSFFNRNKERMTIAIIAVILLIIIGLTIGDREKLTRAEVVTGNILTPVAGWTNKISQNLSGFVGDIRNLPAIKEENESLKERIIELEKENLEYEDLIARSDTLRKEKELLKDSQLNLLGSEIIGLESQIVGKEPGNWFDRFTLDKGSNDGVKKGDTVVQAIEIEEGVIVEGIVGKVIDVGSNWSKIATIVDELSRLSFKIVRTQDGGVISGGLDSKISGFLFDHKADIIKGDKIITSGIGGVYKKDIYVGEVDEVISGDNDLMKEISVIPAIDFKKLYKVYIILDNNEG